MPRRPSCVHERHECRRIGHDRGIEQRLVAGLKIGQQKIFLQVVVEGSELRMRACDLQCRELQPGQQPFEMVLAAFGIGEGGTLVKTRVAKKVAAGKLDRFCIAILLSAGACGLRRLADDTSGYLQPAVPYKLITKLTLHQRNPSVAGRRYVDRATRGGRQAAERASWTKNSRSEVTSSSLN